MVHVPGLDAPAFVAVVEHIWAKDNLVTVETAPVLGEFAKSLGKARLGYLRFMAEGRTAGHQPQFYDVHDQRFLGDERFVEQIGERVQGDREITVPSPKVSWLCCCLWLRRHTVRQRRTW